LSDRTEYFREYRKKHREKRKAYAKKKYKQDRKKRLQYRRKYYILNREVILAKLLESNRTPYGHGAVIHRCIEKYMLKWKLPCMTKKEFLAWSMQDQNYKDLHAAWEESGFQINLAPVCMRTVKKSGCVDGNMTWDTKSNYSWWNEDSRLFEEVSEEVAQAQKERNQRNKEWRKKVRADFKTKQKAKQNG
jgi:hypothetical protein